MGFQTQTSRYGCSQASRRRRSCCKRHANSRQDTRVLPQSHITESQWASTCFGPQVTMLWQKYSVLSIVTSKFWFCSNPLPDSLRSLEPDFTSLNAFNATCEVTIDGFKYLWARVPNMTKFSALCIGGISNNLMPGRNKQVELKLIF